jgi:trans-2,3-dihydro-3-hydroxyanthranilate isomerase
MLRLPITYVDVFAARSLEGNNLPVVHDADDLSQATMGAFARRTRQSETSFLQLPTSEGADYRNRIFTVESEIPFAGHPSLGAAAAYCHRRGLSTAALVQQTAHASHEIEVRLGADSGTVSMNQGECEFGPVIDAEAIALALGISASALHADLRPQLLSTGLPMLVIPLASPQPLHQAHFDRESLAQALSDIDVESTMSLNCYLVAEDSESQWSARCFSLDVPHGEDPATGSSAGPFGAYLKEYLGLTKVSITQGVDMGEPSRLHVDTTGSILVSGDVHIVGTGTVFLPEA